MKRHPAADEQITNWPHHAGKLARPKVRFGDGGQYAVAPVFTRFEAVSWFVWDSETPDEVTGFAGVVRQAATFDEAVAGLD